MTKRALVLAGGGARGAYQVGMLKGLISTQGLDFQIIRGVSVGALNAAFLAQASNQGDSLGRLQDQVKTLEEIWTVDIKGNHTVYGDRGGFAGLLVGSDSLYSLTPLQKLIRQAVSVQKLKDSGRNFAVGVVSLVSGLYRECIPSDSSFLEKLLASSSIPVVFPFVDLKKEKDVLVDGGVRNITPLSSAFAEKPDEIYILLTSRMIRNGSKLPDSSAYTHEYEQWDDNWLGTKIGGLDVLKRTIELLTDEIYLDDIRGALDWNEVAAAVLKAKNAQSSQESAKPVVVAAVAKALDAVEKRYVPLYVLAPREWYGPHNEATDFSPELIKRAIDHGSAIASDRKLWVWPP